MSPKPKPKTKGDYIVGHKRPPKEYAIKKNQILNPLGAGAQDPELRALKKLSKAQFVEVGNVVIQGDMNELQRIAQDKTQSVFKVMLASVAAKIIQKGDMVALDKLMDRFLGKVKQEFQHSGEIAGGGNAQVIVTIPSNGREVAE